MTNKEALERIKTAPAFMCQNGGVYSNYTDSSEVYLKDIKVIEQALDRLEELECKLDKLQEAYDKCNWLNEKQCNMIEGAEKRIIDLLSKIEKLKTGINIIKEFLPDLYFTQSDQMINSKDVILVYDGGGYRGKLTEEEYEILKEVLGDD